MRSPAAHVTSAYATGRIACGDERVFRPGGLALTTRAIAVAGLQPGAVVLDLGCGAGATVRYLRALGIDALGIDCESGGETRAERTHFFTPRIAASAEDLPLPDDSVDGILAECSLSLMQNQDRALSECARVLVHQGSLVISDLYARQPAAIGRVRALKRSCVSGMVVREQLQSQLAEHGFTVELWEDHSQSLRECAARFILEHGSIEELWGCGEGNSSEAIQHAMREARAGYFLAIATRTRGSARKGVESSYE